MPEPTAARAAEETSVWQYNPSFALAVLASILYGIIFLGIFYLTIIKHRSWYFTCVVVGAAVEVAGYALRCYSIKRPSEVVCPSSHSLTQPRPPSNLSHSSVKSSIPQKPCQTLSRNMSRTQCQKKTTETNDITSRLLSQQPSP